MNNIFLGNSINSYFLALGAFVLFSVVLWFIQKVVVKRLEKLSLNTKTDIDDVFIRIIKSIKPGFYSFLAFYLALFFLDINDSVRKWVGIILLVWVVFQVIKAVQVLIDFIIEKKLKGESRDAESAFKFLGNLLKWSLWLIGLVLILGNLGVNVSSLIAGLGIGGIAIAMAIKGILEDLFSSFSIYFDKPFVVGDRIKIGKDSGEVLKIGIKSTRLRSSEGEILVVSNKELTSTRIQNFGVGKLEERKVKLLFGIVYEVSNEKLEKIPQMVEKIIKGVKSARFGRAHFINFGASALDFEVIYFIESSEYEDYLNAQQKINLTLKEAFEKEGIGMAYPTQTLYIAK